MAKSTASRASDAYHAARSNPYVDRLVSDEELRKNLHDAYDAARNAYGRIARNGKKPAKAIGDKKVQRDLKTAAESLRDASEQLRSPQKKRHRLRRLVLFGAVAGGVALAVSENARKSVMDALFGAEEEFEYTSTTSAPTDATNGAS